MKRMFCLLLALVLGISLCLSGCAGANNTGNNNAGNNNTGTTGTDTNNTGGNANQEEEKWLFGYANHNSDENSLKQMKAFVEAAEAWNKAGNTPKIEVTTTTAEMNLDRQIGDIETLIAKGCVAIAIQAVDTVGIVPAVDNCKSNNVKVMEVRGSNIDGIINLKVGDEKVMAENMYNYLAAQLDANPDLVLNVGLMYGNASQTAQLVRVDYCAELLTKNYPGRVNIIAKQPCDWDTQKAQECMENWLQQYTGKMNCIIAAAGMMACGASNAVVAANQSMDDWYFVTVDSTADILHSIKQGQCDMTVGIDVEQAGRDMFDYLVKYVKGEIEPGIYNSDPMTIIDSTNIDDWYVEN